MSRESRDRIAHVLAQRGLMGGSAMAGEPELHQLHGDQMPVGGLFRDWRERFNRQQFFDQQLPPEPGPIDEQLRRPDWVPADQPTGEQIPGYLYMKRRL